MHGSSSSLPFGRHLSCEGRIAREEAKSRFSWVVFHRKRISGSPSGIMGNIAYIVSGRGEEREEDMMRQPPCPGCSLNIEDKIPALL